MNEMIFKNRCIVLFNLDYTLNRELLDPYPGGVYNENLLLVFLGLLIGKSTIADK